MPGQYRGWLRPEQRIQNTQNTQPSQTQENQCLVSYHLLLLGHVIQSCARRTVWSQFAILYTHISKYFEHRKPNTARLLSVGEQSQTSNLSHSSSQFLPSFSSPTLASQLQQVCRSDTHVHQGMCVTLESHVHTFHSKVTHAPWQNKLRNQR